MGPIVPILRLTYLFLNIYDTYKVLKVPAPSQRNGGQPTIRAMTQRKRDMKGIMTIWTIWVRFHPVFCLSASTFSPPSIPALHSVASRHTNAR